MIASEQFRAVMGNVATGITVVTTRGKGGACHGLTVSSFTSVSSDPPLVLVCFDNLYSGLRHFADSRKFGVSILSHRQEDVSRLFAKTGTDRPASIYFDGPSGLPLLQSALAYLECETIEVLPGGDHQIFLGKVVAAGVLDEQSGPILYFRSKYQRIADPAMTDDQG